MKKIILIASALFLLAQVPVSAQLSLFSTTRGNQVNRKDTPTVINSDAMDIDLANNKATFMGNVVVDDPEMTITCRKMTIFLVDDKKNETDAPIANNLKKDEVSQKKI